MRLAGTTSCLSTSIFSFSEDRILTLSWEHCSQDKDFISQASLPVCGPWVSCWSMLCKWKFCVGHLEKLHKGREGHLGYHGTCWCLQRGPEGCISSCRFGLWGDHGMKCGCQSRWRWGWVALRSCHASPTLPTFRRCLPRASDLVHS